MVVSICTIFSKSAKSTCTVLASDTVRRLWKRKASFTNETGSFVPDAAVAVVVKYSPNVDEQSVADQVDHALSEN